MKEGMSSPNIGWIMASIKTIFFGKYAVSGSSPPRRRKIH